MKTAVLTTLAVACLLNHDIADAQSSALLRATETPKLTEGLSTNKQLVSPSGQFSLIMQGDGNLVMYRTECGVGDPKCAFWQSGTRGATAQYNFQLNYDGNIVIYGPNGVHHNFGTAGANGPYFAVLQDDANLVVYNGTGPASAGEPVWSSKTGLIRKPAARERIEIGWMNLLPCEKVEWRQVYNATKKSAEQRLYGYAYVDQSALSRGRVILEQCVVAAAATTSIAAILGSPIAALPTFKAAMSTCLDAKQFDRAVADSVSLSTEARCIGW